MRASTLWANPALGVFAAPKPTEVEVKEVHCSCTGVASGHNSTKLVIPFQAATVSQPGIVLPLVLGYACTQYVKIWY